MYIRLDTNDDLSLYDNTSSLIHNLILIINVHNIALLILPNSIICLFELYCVLDSVAYIIKMSGDFDIEIKI